MDRDRVSVMGKSTSLVLLALVGVWGLALAADLVRISRSQQRARACFAVVCLPKRVSEAHAHARCAEQQACRETGICTEEDAEAAAAKRVESCLCACIHARTRACSGGGEDGCVCFLCARMRAASPLHTR